MDVLNMLRVIYGAYEESDSTPGLYQINSYESFGGIIIESYYGIFCASLITRFGKLKISNGEIGDECKPIERYLKSRITYKGILGVTTIHKGCYGPFYLVTRIDGVPVSNDKVSGESYEILYSYIKPNVGREKYADYITECIQQRMIVDKEGILDRIMTEPNYYPTAVALLIEGLPNPDYFGILDSDMYFHLFVLLVRKKWIHF